MDEKAFLQSYDRQSTDDLIGLEYSHRIDSLVLAFEEILLNKDYLTAEEQVVLAVEALEREVNDGSEKVLIPVLRIGYHADTGFSS